MGFTIEGLPAVLAKIDALEARVRQQATRTVQNSAARLHDKLRERTSHEFQEVQTYIWESVMGLPGTKSEYADEDLVGIFSKKSAPVPTEPWDRQIQLYRKERHQLRELLRTQFKEKPTGVFLSHVGYPRNVGRRGSRTRYIVWVMFGTKKMHARPFLQLALDDDKDAFLQEFREALKDILVA